MFEIEKTLNFGEPIDTIIVIKENIYLGSYCHEEGIRNGHIFIIDKDSYKEKQRVETSGTLYLFNPKSDDYFIAVNAADISKYSLDGKLVKKVKSEYINTNGVCNEFIYTIDVKGNLFKYDSNLNIINVKRIIEQPLWAMYSFENEILIGAEDGSAHKYNVNTEESTCFYEDNFGVIGFVRINDEIHMSTYEGKVISFDKKLDNPKAEHKNVGDLWRMIYSGNIVVASSIYEGFKIFDISFNNLLYNFKTSSICYGISFINDKKIIFSSFYDCQVFIGSIN